MLSQLRTGMSCYALDRHCWMPVVIAQKNHHILVLTTLFGMLLAQSELEIACSHSCRIQDTCLAVHAAMKTIRSLQKALCT